MAMRDYNYRLQEEARRKRNAARIRKALVTYRIKSMRQHMRISERIVWAAGGALATAMGMLLWQCAASS